MPTSNPAAIKSKPATSCEIVLENGDATPKTAAINGMPQQNMCMHAIALAPILVNLSITGIIYGHRMRILRHKYRACPVCNHSLFQNYMTSRILLVMGLL